METLAADNLKSTDLLRPQSAVGNIVLIHPGRCGSTVLADMLGQHSEISWDGEVFNEHAKSSVKSKIDMIMRGGSRWLNFRKVFANPGEYIQFRKRLSARTNYGFEIKYHDLESNPFGTENFFRRVTEPTSDKLISLTRRNLLRVLVSGLVAQEQTKYHLTTSESPSITRLDVKPDRLSFTRDIRDVHVLQLLERMDQTYNSILPLIQSNTVLNLVYEDHIEPDPKIAYREVCRFLDLDTQPVVVRYARTTPFSLRDVLVNFEAFATALSGTKYQWMIDC